MEISEVLESMIEDRLSKFSQNDLTDGERGRILSEIKALDDMLIKHCQMDLDSIKTTISGEKQDLESRKVDLDSNKYELELRKLDFDEKKYEDNKDFELRKLDFDERRYEEGKEQAEKDREAEMQKQSLAEKRAKRDKIIEIVMKVLGFIGSVGMMFSGRMFDKAFETDWLARVLAFEKDEMFSSSTTKEVVRDIIGGIFRKK